MAAPEHAAEVRLVDCRGISDAALANYLEWLGPSEMVRYARFVRRERRRQFVVGRMLLRQSLGQLLGMPARALTLVERADNAPLLDLPGRARPGFSLSHSGDWVACAVSASTALGLDIELIDVSRNISELAAQALEPEQQVWLAARPDASRVHDFYQLWSAKEARFKLNAPVAYEATFYHPELSAALCCAQPLACAPQLQDVALPFPARV